MNVNLGLCRLRVQVGGLIWSRNPLNALILNSTASKIFQVGSNMPIYSHFFSISSPHNARARSDSGKRLTKGQFHWANFDRFVDTTAIDVPSENETQTQTQPLDLSHSESKTFNEENQHHILKSEKEVNMNNEPSLKMSDTLNSEPMWLRKAREVQAKMNLEYEDPAHRMIKKVKERGRYSGPLKLEDVTKFLKKEEDSPLVKVFDTTKMFPFVDKVVIAVGRSLQHVDGMSREFIKQFKKCEFEYGVSQLFIKHRENKELKMIDAGAIFVYIVTAEFLANSDLEAAYSNDQNSNVTIVRD